MARDKRLGTANLGDIVPSLGERVALIDERAGGTRWTATGIREAAAAIAGGLRERGCPPGDAIAIIAENSGEFLCCYLGIMQAGLVAVPVNYRLPAETIAFILNDCGARLALVDAVGRSVIPSDFPIIRLDSDGPGTFEALVTGKAMYPTEPIAGEIATILYTSGSTGRPKGVPLSHSGQLWALGIHALPEKTTGESTLIVAPMYHMNALFNMSVALINGVEIVLMPRFEARSWLGAIATHRCTRLSGIPSMFAMAARERDLIDVFDLSSVTRITIGSAPLTEALVDRVRAIFPNALVTNGYGTTEAGPSIFGEHPQGLVRPPLALGYPLAEVELRLTEGTDEQGVLELRTPAQLDGYLNLPDATAERIRDGWYITGDIMRRDEQGFFYFVGRADDMFVCGGENVYPGEVEKLLERHPDVMQAAVVAVPDEIKGHIPIAFVVPAPDAALSEAQLKDFALAEGPAFSHPRAVLIVDELPVAGTHKIDKRPLLPLAIKAARALKRG
ncbi:MAG: class I adenylate-forming enzyme family protein [Sphingopyxis sp.]